MEFVNAIIGQKEMYVPVNKKLGEMIMLADKRLNYKKHLAKRQDVYIGPITTRCVRMCSDFIFALEDVMEEYGYYEVFHILLTEYPIEQRKFYYELFRENKTFRFFMLIRGYEEEQIEEMIRDFFEKLKTKII